MSFFLFFALFLGVLNVTAPFVMCMFFQILFYPNKGVEK